MAGAWHRGERNEPERTPLQAGPSGTEGFDASRGKRAERAQMRRKHVFVVNGAPEFLDLVRELLQEERYNVTTTNYVPRTFDQVATLAPDLLVVDVVVGHQAGWDLLERMHAEAATSGIPVVVTSTSPALLNRVRALTDLYGGHAFLAKPFDLDALVEVVRELIGPA